MAQYCRYCFNMVCGDVNYCSLKQRIYTDEQICRTNTCKDFELNPIDALGVNDKGYKPREHIKPVGEQIKIETEKDNG